MTDKEKVAPGKTTSKKTQPVEKDTDSNIKQTKVSDFWDTVKEKPVHEYYEFIKFVDEVTETIPLSNWTVHHWKYKNSKWGKDTAPYLKTDDYRMLNINAKGLQSQLKPYADKNLKVTLAITRYRSNNQYYYAVNEVVVK